MDRLAERPTSFSPQYEFFDLEKFPFFCPVSHPVLRRVQKGKPCFHKASLSSLFRCFYILAIVP